MTTLNIGVHDLSYAAGFGTRASGRGRRGSARRGYGTNKTTGDVAELLEAKYKLFSTFYEMNKKMIVDEIKQSLVCSVRNVFAGQPAAIDVNAEACSRITAKFKDDLAMRKFDGVIKGVPTHAAQLGISHRFKDPAFIRRGGKKVPMRRGSPVMRRHPERPSFIDTGQLQSSLVCWVEK
jgi:hypothetical protein